MGAAPPRPRGGRYRLQRTADDVTRRRAGDPNVRGRFERPNRAFHLREGLSAPGEMPIDEAVRLVFADWERQAETGLVSGEIVHDYKKSISGFAGLLRSRGLHLVSEIDTNLALYWLTAPTASGAIPAQNSSYHRRSATRAFFITAQCLGITNLNPAKSVELPERTGRYVHPFTDEQIHHLQRSARARLDDLRTPAILALVMSGAATQQVGFVQVADVDTHHGRVWIAADSYRWRPRWIPLYDRWCQTAVLSRVEQLEEQGGDDPTRWLTYVPHSNASKRGQEQVGVRAITALLKTARLHQPGVTRAESIREWLAIKVFEETGRVEDVAERLGMSSLDAAAHILHYDWVQDRGGDDTPPVHRRAGKR